MRRHRSRAYLHCLGLATGPAHVHRSSSAPTKTWGGESNDKWSDAYFEGALHWSSVLNFGLEAMGLATFVAMINQDPEAARRAVLVNTLYVGATPGWGVGLFDKNATLPAKA